VEIAELSVPKNPCLRTRNLEWFRTNQILELAWLPEESSFDSLHLEDVTVMGIDALANSQIESFATNTESG